MTGVNKVILIGNLGRDPESHSMQDGSKIVNLTLATSETWNDKGSGERREKTEWHRVAIFNERLADVAEKYLRKGSKVYIEGALQTRKWTDGAGVEKFTTEVVLARYRGELTMLNRSNDSSASNNQPRATAATPARRPADTATTWHGGGRDIDDDVPF